MTTEPPAKEFDCIRFVREARARINAALEGKSREEQIHWFETRRPQHPGLAGLFDERVAPKGRRTPAPRADP